MSESESFSTAIVTDETTTPDEPRVSKTDEETVLTVTQFNRYDVLIHPEG